jgi:SAM-dependent methyltransferase
MPQLPRSLAVRAFASAGYRLTRLSARIQTQASVTADVVDGPTLAGDRDVEWAWSLAHLSKDPGDVLDFGAGHGLLSLGAAFAGHRVTALDLEPRSFAFDDDRITYVQKDVNAVAIPEASFDQIINCSTVEHVGLAGRYGSTDDPDGDLAAMQRLRTLLRPGGTMVLTVPVGRDGTYAPYHRVYGPERLPRLLDGFEVEIEEYRAKQGTSRWERAERDAALATQGSATYYALGLFVLRRT